MLSLLGVAARAPGVAAPPPGPGLAASLGVMRRGAMPFLAPGVVGGPPAAASCRQWLCRVGLGWAGLDMLWWRLSAMLAPHLIAEGDELKCRRLELPLQPCICRFRRRPLPWRLEQARAGPWRSRRGHP